MGELSDIPYSKLKANKRAYEIMRLRDLCDNTFTAIAQEYGVSIATITSNYYRVKIRQLRFYINHLAIVNGHESTAEFRKLFYKVNDCYQDYKYVTAYFEKEYKNLLTEYRAGEPGLPESFLAQLPPFKEKWSKYIVSRVVKMREEEHRTFVAIGVKLKMTTQSAEHIYGHYYHEKLLALSKRITAKNNLKDVHRKYFDLTRGSKKRYEMLCEDYPEFTKKKL